MGTGLHGGQCGYAKAHAFGKAGPKYLSPSCGPDYCWSAIMGRHFLRHRKDRSTSAFYGSWIERYPSNRVPRSRTLIIMRNSLCAIAFLLTASFAQATDLFTQLCAFNPYWADHREVLEGIPAKPIGNDVDYVQAHLTEVLKVLSAATTGQLSQEQLSSRRS